MIDAAETPKTGSDAGQTRRLVLITGAAGRIGSSLAAYLAPDYDLRLMVRGDEPQEKRDEIAAFGPVTVCDLADLDGLKRLAASVDSIVHLAGNAWASAPWADLLQTNIIGTYNVYAAAKWANVRRVIFASSIHAVSGYDRARVVRVDDPVNPGDIYGVTKCFGEALGRYMAEQEGVAGVAVRIGGWRKDSDLSGVPLEHAARGIDAFITARDLNQLFVRCIETEPLTFAIAHALSGDRFGRMDIQDTRRTLGYAPQDDLTRQTDALRAIMDPEKQIYHSRSDGWERSGLRDQLGDPAE